MADLSVTANNVRVLNSTPVADLEVVQVGEAVTPMQPLYLKVSDSKYYKAVSSSLEAAAADRVAMGHASADDYVISQKSGEVDPGAAPAVGERYYVSGTAGGLQPSGDVGSGELVTRCAICTAANKLKLDFDASGITKA